MPVRVLIISMFGMLFISSQTLFAQYQHNAWFRGTVNVSLSSKLTLDTELQHRRQRSPNTSNFLGENLLHSYRNWLHYQHQPYLKFSLSPFAYFNHYKILQSEDDRLGTPNHEVRFSAAFEIQLPLAQNFYIIDRSAVEYRVLSNASSDITRFRNRLGVKYDLNNRLHFTLSNEFILNTSGVPLTHFFDQNRIGFNVEYQVLNNLKFDLGYIHLIRFPVHATSALYEHNIYFNLAYKLFQK